MTIHHAVAKKAKANGVIIEAVAGTDQVEYTATHIASGKEARAASATAALADVLKAVKAAAPKKARALKAKKAKGKKRAKRRSSDEDEDGEEDGEEGGDAKSIVKKKYKQLYRPTKDSNGDDFADALHGCLFPDGEEFDMAAFARTCRANKVKEDSIKKWGKLKNNGMRRMNLANVLRGMIRRGETVTLGAKTFKGGLKSLPKRKA